MIKVNVFKDKIEIKGHSGYDIMGRDIVCSATSSIVTTSINGIISIDENSINYNYEKDKMTITILKENEIVEKLIQNMLDMLKELSISYPKNIEVKERI